MAPRCSALVGHRLGPDPIEQALFLQRAVGNQATLRVLARQGSNLTGSGPRRRNEPEADPKRLTAPGTTPSVSKLVVRQVHDPGKHEFDPYQVEANALETATDAGTISPGGDESVADAGSTDEQPIWHSTSPVPVDILADTAQDFVTKANAARGGDEVGHMESIITYAPDVDTKGKIGRVNLTVETSIVRPHWAGGRPTDAQRAAIGRAEQSIKEHEERHRNIARDFASRMVKAMRGKSSAAADKEFKQLEKSMDQAQAELDRREGCMSVIEKPGSDGGVTVEVIQGSCQGGK
jgi:hypothetical protein